MQHFDLCLPRSSASRRSGRDERSWFSPASPSLRRLRDATFAPSAARKIADDDARPVGSPARTIWLPTLAPRRTSGARRFVVQHEDHAVCPRRTASDGTRPRAARRSPKRSRSARPPRVEKRHAHAHVRHDARVALVDADAHLDGRLARSAVGMIAITCAGIFQSGYALSGLPPAPGARGR